MEQTAPSETLSVTSARDLLVEWANRQDGWVRALVGEVMATQAALTPLAEQAVFERYLLEKGLADGEAEPVEPLVLPDAPAAEANDFFVTRLAEVSGVNALAPEQEISFNTALTVLFGENGAGKTGYARILKSLAAVRTAEDILGDVHSGGTGSPHATIEYALGGVATELDWAGESGVPPFTSISIFDSPCVMLHVDEDLAYVYTPADLALFPHVTAGIERVRDLLEERRTATRPSGNSFLPMFSRESAVYASIETLGATTDLEALGKLADVPQEEVGTLPTLETQVQALQANTIPAQITVAQSSKERYQALAKAARALSRLDSDAYNQAVETARAAEAAYATARTELFSAAALDGEGDETWQTFILAADSYREHLARHDYPSPGDSCLYCRQDLNDQSLELLRRYRTFASDESRRRIADAKAMMGTLSREILSVEAQALQEDLKREQGQGSDAVLARGLALVTAAMDIQEACREGRGVDQFDRAEADGLAGTADGRAATAAETIAALQAKSGERAEALAKAAKAYAQLKDRITLGQRLAAITDHVNAARWDSRAGTLASRIPNVLRSLTETSKVASQDLLNTDFSTRFQAECRALRAPEVALEFPGRRGQSARRKKVTSHKPSAVLSEGEQKVIALADFLAEAALRLTAAPLVFDDPVNSLDYRRIHEVADRVARLAADRQVIVFTHNIWFATELLARFEGDLGRCSYYAITDEPAKGVVTRGTHPRWDTLKKTRGRINDVIQSAKSTDGETREALLERGYSLIRTWCEIAVETELLASVTQRYQANVSMTKLSQIRGDRLDAATAVIMPIFEKACRIIDGHSQPLETLSIRPTSDELEGDWKALQEALAAYKADGG